MLRASTNTPCTIRNPRAPWTAEEIAADALACREAGASVLHFHAREPDGSPAFSYQRYVEVARAVRTRSDVLVHPRLWHLAHRAELLDPRATSVTARA